jgi:hypothetical protein
MADNNLGTYNPEQIVAVLTVPDHPEVAHVVSGWAEGTFLTFEKTTPSSTLILGADNTGGRLRRTTKGGTINFTLQMFTASNDILTQLEKNDGSATDNSWLFDLTIKDGMGRSFLHAKQCFIVNTPSMSFGTDATDTRSWDIQAINIDYYIGGSAKIPAEIASTLTAMGVIVDPSWVIGA